MSVLWHLLVKTFLHSQDPLRTSRGEITYLMPTLRTGHRGGTPCHSFVSILCGENQRNIARR